MTRRGLQFLADEHRNPDFWTEVRPGRFEFKGWSTMPPPTLRSFRQTESKLPEFSATNTFEFDQGREYIVIGKGWPDIAASGENDLEGSA